MRRRVISVICIIDTLYVKMCFSSHLSRMETKLISVGRLIMWSIPNGPKWKCTCKSFRTQKTWNVIDYCSVEWATITRIYASAATAPAANKSRNETFIASASVDSNIYVARKLSTSKALGTTVSSNTIQYITQSARLFGYILYDIYCIFQRYRTCARQRKIRSVRNQC